MTKTQKARRVIKELLDVAQEGALVPIQDGGKHVDIVWSRTERESPMSLSESERLMDRAIRAAYKAITGEAIPRGVDPVEFIYGER
jgi:hypothetical protein